MTLAEWLERIERLHPKAWDPGLERVGEVADRLGVRRPAPRVVLVAGTNGKGSTVEMIDRLCREQGLSVGKSVSPHLVRFNERIVIDGAPADDDEIVAAFETIDDVRGDISLSYFEFGALAAMVIFQRRGVDVAVLEIGLGGRLDAMNVAAPDVSVITRIALDHQDWLGDDREAIGAEKAGIMRRDVPCIIADPDPPASLAVRGSEVGARCLVVGRDFGLADDAKAGERAFFAGDLMLDSLPLVSVPTENLLAAIQATLCLDVSLTAATVHAALGDFALAGRFEWREGARRTLLDVAHNPDAAAWLAERLASLDLRSCHAVFGMYGDKDIAAVVACLAPFVDAWYIAGMDVGRGATPEVIAPVVTDAGGSVIGKYAKVSDAYDAAVENTRQGDVILVFGSFIIVGGVLEHLDQGRL